LATIVDERTRLKLRVDELGDQLAEVLRHAGQHHQPNRFDDFTVISEHTQRQIDGAILDIRRQADKENAQLRGRVAELESEVSALRFQLDVYKGDFETERADREKAVGREADAKAQLAVERHRAAELETKLQDAWTQLKNAVAFNAQQTRVMRTMEHRALRSSNYSQLISRGSGNDVTDAACPEPAAAKASSSCRALEAESSALVHQLDCLSSSLQRRSSSCSPSPSSYRPTSDPQLGLVSLDGFDETDGGGIAQDSMPLASATPVRWWLTDASNRDNLDSNLIDLDLISDTESQTLSRSSSSSPHQIRRTAADRNHQRLQGRGSSSQGSAARM
jgi:hypothetical protein